MCHVDTAFSARQAPASFQVGGMGPASLVLNFHRSASGLAHQRAANIDNARQAVFNVAQSWSHVVAPSSLEHPVSSPLNAYHEFTQGLSPTEAMIQKFQEHSSAASSGGGTHGTQTAHGSA